MSRAPYPAEIRVVTPEDWWRALPANVADGYAAKVVAAVELGLSTLAGDRPVYVNLPERFLLGEYPIPLPPERTLADHQLLLTRA